MYKVKMQYKKVKAIKLYRHKIISSATAAVPGPKPREKEEGSAGFTPAGTIQVLGSRCWSWRMSLLQVNGGS